MSSHWVALHSSPVLAIDGANLICLRWLLAIGPLQAGPLLPWTNGRVTRDLLFVILAILEIGKLRIDGVHCVQLPLATLWLAERLGGETEEPTTELGVHGRAFDREDDGLGARVRSCATPFPIIVSRVPCPSSTRLSAGEASSGARCVGEETTLGATRCANMCTLLLAGVGGT